ncbi:MAG: hypothetical protein KY475_23050, partial [Planctomycetes bacterium]|nr:hypothetical protein [Planctomycetota bacterium]
MRLDAEILSAGASWKVDDSSGLSRTVRRTCILVMCFALSGCRGPQSMFESAGPEAAAIIKLWWVLFGVGLVVSLLVLGFLLVGCLRTRQERRAPASDRTLRRALLIGVSATIFLLLAILLAAHRYSQPLADERDDALTIEVAGKRWWWSVVYL